MIARSLRTLAESALARLPRAGLGIVESPVEVWPTAGGDLLVKREDRNAPVMGGNKARALEMLLASVTTPRGIVTVGGIGSTHILATAVHAARIGHATRAYRWQHYLNPVGTLVDRAILSRCAEAPLVPAVPLAFVAASWRRSVHGDWWVPFGGTSSLGVLGHVEAALELARQVGRGTAPGEVVLPLGSGGTTAGIALGLEICGLGAQVRAVRCGPRSGLEPRWIAHLLRGAARRLGLPTSAVAGAMARVIIDHTAWSGAYALPLPGDWRRALPATPAGALLDDTYAARACYVATRRVAELGAPILFWHTFDARWMEDAA